MPSHSFTAFLFSPIPHVCEWPRCSCRLFVPLWQLQHHLWSYTCAYLRQVQDWHGYIHVLSFFLPELVPHSSFDLLSSFSFSACNRSGSSPISLPSQSVHCSALKARPGLLDSWSGEMEVLITVHCHPAPAYLSPVLYGELLEDRHGVISVMVSSTLSRVLLFWKGFRGALYRVHE